MLRKQTKEEGSTSFSFFIRNASSGEKKRVYKEVIACAIKDQAAVIDSVPDFPKRNQSSR